MWFLVHLQLLKLSLKARKYKYQMSRPPVCLLKSNKQLQFHADFKMNRLECLTASRRVFTKHKLNTFFQICSSYSINQWWFPHIWHTNDHQTVTSVLHIDEKQSQKTLQQNVSHWNNWNPPLLCENVTHFLSTLSREEWSATSDSERQCLNL